MPGMADNGRVKREGKIRIRAWRASAHTHKHYTKFLWYMVKSRWHRFDQNNNMALIHMLFFCARHRSGLRAIHAHTQFFSRIFQFIFHLRTHKPCFLSSLVVFVFVIPFHNVQCKFHIYFHHLKKIVPVSNALKASIEHIIIIIAVIIEYEKGSLIVSYSHFVYAPLYLYIC